MKLDTLNHRDTPEGIALTLLPAGPVVRWLAWCLDALAMVALWTLAAFIFGILGAVGNGLFLIFAFAITWFYPVVFEVLKDGSTPGKRSFGLQVIHDDGTPIDLHASVLRNLLRTADFLPFAFAAGLSSMLLDRNFRRLGDLVAGTMVIHRERTLNTDQVPEEAPLAPPVALLPEERQAVVGFASRVSRWNSERAVELAMEARPLTSATGSDAIRRLVAMANWLLGRRIRP